MPDYYPANMQERANWHRNFAANLPDFAAKYNITPAQLSQVAADNEWVRFWVAQRFQATIFASQLAAYFNSVSGNDPSLDPPGTPNYSVPAPSAEVPTGIEFRSRELARHIKGHSSFSEADGVLLGIIGEIGGAQAISGEIKPTIKTTAAPSSYKFTVSVSIRGKSDAWQVWATVAGENNWQNIATATGRSAEVVYTPLDRDNKVPYQLQVRVQLRRSNQNYGKTSNIATVTVVP